MTSEVKIEYANALYIPSFQICLDLVAKEKIYIEMIEAPELEKVRAFQEELIARNMPVFYAVRAGRVVGWCDISGSKNPRMQHRGGLGMGLLAEYRGKGWGTKLMIAALAKAKVIGIEKVELSVYTTNAPAIALYRKMGFEEEGTIKMFRKLDNQYFDCLQMAKFL